MFATILLVVLSKAAAAAALAFFVGIAVGYAFRGKEHSALSRFGQDIKSKM